MGVIIVPVTNSISYFLTLKSALQSISHKNLSNPITQDILLKYNDLSNYHYNIIFCWIPSHVGIKGNTEADKLACVTTISSTQVIPIPPSDVLHSLELHPYQMASFLGFFPKQQTLQNIS